MSLQTIKKAYNEMPKNPIAIYIIPDVVLYKIPDDVLLKIKVVSRYLTQCNIREAEDFLYIALTMGRNIYFSQQAGAQDLEKLNAMFNEMINKLEANKKLEA